jgi:hypothetical protein
MLSERTRSPDDGGRRGTGERTWGSREFLVEKLDAEILGLSHNMSSGGSAMVITPRVTLSLPRTLPSPNMCFVANVTDDPAGSMAYRPAGGACTAVLVVDITAVPFLWDQWREKPRGRRAGGLA